MLFEDCHAKAVQDAVDMHNDLQSSNTSDFPPIKSLPSLPSPSLCGQGRLPGPNVAHFTVYNKICLAFPLLNYYKQSIKGGAILD